MLIVSQNKEEIINIDNCINISIVKQYGEDEEIDIVKYVNIVCKSSYSGCFLGYYKTEERAKEVLQEIIKKYSSYLELQGGPAILQGQMDIQPNIFHIPKVYEMPKE
ncbi:MAG: long-chain fatty acid--CoA ligase [Clostridia bacterium]